MFPGDALRRRSFDAGPEESGSLAGALARRLGMTTGEATALVARGAVYVRGRRSTDPSRRVRTGDRVMVVLEESGRPVLAPEPAPPPLVVLHRDPALLAVDKPAGLPAQATPGGATSLVDLVARALGRAPGLVHRLDRETSGVTLFGLTPAATAALAAEFRAGRVVKQYLGATGPALPEAGTIDRPLVRDRSRPGRWRAASGRGVPALTEFRRLGGGEGYALAALRPRTGRTHQLRAHLASLGAPLVGDARYGGARRLGGDAVPRCLLHAQALIVRHPLTGRPVTLLAPLPEDLGRLFVRSGVPVPAAPEDENG